MNMLHGILKYLPSVLLLANLGSASISTDYFLNKAQSEHFHFTIALKQNNINIVKDLVLSHTSNITSPDYGEY